MRDIAWAKINLTLEVLGRRADGFHELRSLVAFASFGDTVELTPAGDFSLKIEGPFASALVGGNLIADAERAAKARVPALASGHFRLVKTLPVAAGLGGGSADAGAALRLLRRLNPDLGDAASLAPDLGSDVAACLASKPALMTGRGETVTPVSGFPSCGVLLANPGVPLATKDVYGALSAPSYDRPPGEPSRLDFAGDFSALLDYATPRGNGLEEAAVGLSPEIENVLAALRVLDGARLVRLSGSGPTCFAAFATARDAHRAASILAQHEPDWWIASGAFGDPVSHRP